MLLAIDTSTQWMGMAVYDGSQVVGEMVWQTHHHHTVELAPSLQELLQRCDITVSRLQALGVALGPGSFTSLRIGLAFTKGMALGLSLPVVGIPTLDILAAAQPVRDLPLAVALQAGRGRLALGWYAAENGRWQAQGEVKVTTVEQLAQSIQRPTLVCGELSAVERQVLQRKRKNVLLISPAQALRRPAWLAELAWRRWQARQVDDPVGLAPIYLHIAEPIPD